MLPMLIVTLIERLAFKHSHYEVNTSTSSIIFALFVFTLTCGLIILVCYLFEKPSEITVEIARRDEEDPPSYFEEWEGESPFIIMYLIYGLITLVGFYLLSDAAIKGIEYMHYFRKYAFFLIIIDIIITVIMRHEIAPSIPHSIVGMIHFETSYMLRAVWIIAFMWGLLYLTIITILIGGAILGLISWKE